MEGAREGWREGVRDGGRKRERENVVMGSLTLHLCMVSLLLETIGEI